MARTETIQPQQSEAQATEQQLHERDVLKNVRQEVSAYNKRFQYKILSAALDEVQPSIDAADKLAGMEGKVRAIYDRLPVRTKALIAILQRIQAVEGMSVGVDYGNDILFNVLCDEKFVEEALKENPEDEDLACLNEAYGLAELINNLS